MPESPDDLEIRRLRKRSAKDASLCADCFRPLAPTDSVTMTWRDGIRTRRDWSGKEIAAYNGTLRVPICLLCSLTVKDTWQWWRGVPALFRCELENGGGFDVRRMRCHGCGRPMRIFRAGWHFGAIPSGQLVCCTDCHRALMRRRDRERKRVRHDEIICTECGKRFTPQRAGAETCSNRCRQARFRRTRRGG